LEDETLPSPRRRALAGAAGCLAVGVAAFCGVVGGVGGSLLTAAVGRTFGPATLVAPALAGGLVGTLSGLAARGWRGSGPWPSLVGAFVAVGIVVVPALLSARQNWQVGTVLWAILLALVLCAVGVLVRRGAILAAAVTGAVGGLLAVDTGVTASLAWLVRDVHTFDKPLVWLWFRYSFDGTRRSFPNTLDLADEVGFWPHELMAATAFAACLVLISQRVAGSVSVEQSST
jgi:hypothetical protein